MDYPECARIQEGWGLSTSETEPFCRHACTQLVISGADGVQDHFLWEHTVRVTGSIPHIVRLSGVNRAEIDLLGLFIASLYHNAGWVLQVRDRATDRFEVLAKPTSDMQRELAAGLVEETLREPAGAGSIDVASRAIRQMNSRSTDMLEAQILADAEGLDEIGPLFFWQMVRHQSARGRAIEACIEAWKSKQEYDFWNARLNRFRFDAVRRVARARLRALEQYIEAVTHQARAQDLREIAQPAAR